jgi:hypothetical protein
MTTFITTILLVFGNLFLEPVGEGEGTNAETYDPTELNAAVPRKKVNEEDIAF